MLFAMCADAGMLLGILFVYILLAGVVVALFGFAVTALVKWADARQKRKAAGDSSEPLPAASPGSVRGV